MVKKKGYTWKPGATPIFTREDLSAYSASLRLIFPLFSTAETQSAQRKDFCIKLEKRKTKNEKRHQTGAPTSDRVWK